MSIKPGMPGYFDSVLATCKLSYFRTPDRLLDALEKHSLGWGTDTEIRYAAKEAAALIKALLAAKEERR